MKLAEMLKKSLQLYLKFLILLIFQSEYTSHVLNKFYIFKSVFANGNIYISLILIIIVNHLEMMI